MTEITEYQPTAGTLITPAAEQAGALISGSLALLDGSYRLAQTLVQTNFAPPHFRGKPEEGAVAVMYGAQLGLDPLQSLQNITVISGRPGMYARTMHALVLRAGHRVTVTESGPERVVVTGQRKGSPDVETSEWTTERARRAGYTSNKKYETEPEAMLRARALADVCRLIAPDVLMGLAYTAEELEFIDEPAEHKPLPKKGRESAADLIGTPPAAPEPTPAPEPEAEAAEPMVTPAQLKKIGAAMRDLGITERTHALAYIQQAIDVEVASRSDLTREQAGRLIDALEEDQAQQNGAAAPEQPELPVDGGEA